MAFRLRLIPVLLTLLTATAFGQFGEFGGDEEEVLTARPLVAYNQVVPGDTLWIGAKLSLATAWHVNSSRPLDDYLIPTNLALDLPPTLSAGEIRYPEGETIPLLGEQMSVYESGATILVPVIISGDTPAGPLKFSGILDYQCCNNTVCLAPSQQELTWRATVASERGDLLHPDVFASVVGGTPSMSETPPVTQVPTQANALEELVQKYGIWGYVLALGVAFGTGLLLSFSPCTYPMIPITVSIFAGQARGMGRGFFLSLLYVLTMAVIYGIMGAVVASVGGVFGAWLAHPAVVGVIVAIFVIFALSMFGLYELQVPGSLRNKMAGKGGGGVGGAIVLGAVAALVISPCVGPFVAGIMLYIATSGSALMGFMVLFTFAMGLGTLFLLIGTFSSAIQALPNAGAWMESVKKFFGFVLLLMALYFLRTLISVELTALLTGLLLLVAGVFGGGFDRLTPDSTFFPRLKKTFGVLCTLIGIYLLGGYLVSAGLIWPAVNTGAIGSVGHGGIEEKIAWQTDLDSGLELGRKSGRPVLIDTWATWCANCKKLDKSTWVDDRVADESKRFVALKLQLEKSDSPETRHFMKQFGMKTYSLPTIILINSQGNVQDVIQGYKSPADMLELMKRVS